MQERDESPSLTDENVYNIQGWALWDLVTEKGIDSWIQTSITEADQMSAKTLTSIRNSVRQDCSPQIS